VQTLLTLTVDQLARETGFVRRTSKLSGAHFVQALVLGWLNNPNATLQQLAQMVGTMDYVRKVLYFALWQIPFIRPPARGLLPVLREWLG
jgi:hypothetical protein